MNTIEKVKKADIILSITRSKPTKNSQTKIPIQKISYGTNN